MDPTLLAVLAGVAVIAAIVYFTVFNKPSTPQLPEGEEPEKQPEKKPNELKKKLDDKREDQKKTTDDRATKAAEEDDKKKAEEAKKKAEADEAEKKAAAQKAEAEKKVAEEEAKREADRKAEEARKAEDERKAKEAAAKAAEVKITEVKAAEPPPPVSEPLPRRAPPPPAKKDPSKRDVAGVRKGLAKSTTEGGFFARLSALVKRKEIPAGLIDELQEVLLTSDVGMKTTDKLLERVKLGLEKNELSDTSRVWDALRDEAKKILSVGGGGIVVSGKPTVVMMVGVNGAGKTTTIGKIATKLTNEKRAVVMAAGDTFRAAAVQQLEVWGKRVGCPVVKGKDGADPAGVVFDAINQAKQGGADVLLCDTAGRLQTKVPLMDELKKIARSAAKSLDGAPHETLLVIDATNGQNALAQAKLFNEALPLTGIILTKLDGTAKGGIILSICDELGVPVRYIGLGERSDDLHEFDADEYVEAVFGEFGKGEAA